MVKKRKDYEFYTTVDEKGQIQMHDRTAEIAAKHAPPPIPKELIEAWKTKPDDQALQELLELYRAQGIDVSEARFKLDCLREIIALKRPQAPPPGSAPPVIIMINTPGDPGKRRIVNVTPPPPSQSSSEEAEQESIEKKEDAPP